MYVNLKKENMIFNISPFFEPEDVELFYTLYISVHGMYWK